MRDSSIRRGVWTILASVAFCASCADPRLGQIADDVDEYIVGVQYEDYRGLVKHMGPFRAAIAETPPEHWQSVGEDYEEQVVARFADYEQAKQSGRFSLDDDGIALLQALAVGKGIYYQLREILLDESGETATATMEVKLDYGPHRFEPFPTGTKVFVMKEPLGSLHVIMVGEPVAEPLRRVETIELAWRLRWYPAVDVYPEGWAVESIQARAETVQFTSWSPDPLNRTLP